MHDSGEWGGVETSQEKQQRVKRVVRDEQTRRRMPSSDRTPALSGRRSQSRSPDDYESSGGESDYSGSSGSDGSSYYSDDGPGDDDDGSPQSQRSRERQSRSKRRSGRTKRRAASQTGSAESESASGRPEFDLSAPSVGGLTVGGRSNFRKSVIFEGVAADEDEPEALIQLEEKWLRWWEDEPTEPSIGNGTAKDFEEKMAVVSHRKRLQKTMSVIDVSTPVKPCWHYSKAGDLKKRRKEREKEVEIAQEKAQVKSNLSNMSNMGSFSGGQQSQPRHLKPLEYVNGVSRRKGSGGSTYSGSSSAAIGQRRRDLLADQILEKTASPPPPAPPWYSQSKRAPWKQDPRGHDGATTT